MTIGPVIATDRTNLTGLLLRQNSAVIPNGTRKLAALLTMTRTDGSYNDGYADNLSLILRAGNIPTLAITRNSSQIQLTWPTNATGFQLETATNLASPTVWSGFPTPPAIVGTNFFITTALIEPQRYFRLRK